MEMEPTQCQSSAFDLTTVKQEPVEAELLASPKREGEFVFVKVETPCLEESEAPDGHVGPQDPLSNDKEECSPSEYLLVSCIPNIVKVEYEEGEAAMHKDDEEVESEPVASPKREGEFVFVKVEPPEYSASEDLLGPGTSNVEKTEDVEEEEATANESDGQELNHELESTSSGSESESAIPVGVEDNSGKDDSDGLASDASLPAGTSKKKQTSTKLKPSIRKLVHSCNVCHKTFTSRSCMMRHKRIHAAERPYTCDTCNKTFQYNWALKRHFQLHTGERPYTCDFCNKTFTQSGSLKSHLLLHTGERPYCCSVCNKTFTKSGTLKRHSQLHTGETPFSCKECNKTFTQSGKLKQHLLSHTGERPYCCGVCNKTFMDNWTLKRHLVCHTGEHPYCCGICNKTFTQSSTLKQHSLLHTGERPHSCGVCNKSFADKSSLKRHSQLHIGETLQL